MNLIIVFITVTVVMMSWTSSAYAELKLPKIKTSARGLFSSKSHPKPALRSRVTVKESPIIKMYGYFERVLYENGDCTDAVSKNVLAINVCALSANSDHIGEYTKATVYAYPDYNYYEIDSQYFSDSACTSVLSTETITLPILICDNNELDHVISQPLSPAGDNLGFSFLLYDSASNCVNNNYQVGVTEAVYAPMNQCLEPDDPSSGTDTMVVSCSSAGLVTNLYATNDGSCGGAPDSYTWTYADFCTSSSPDETIVDVYYGYVTYGCATNPV